MPSPRSDSLSKIREQFPALERRAGDVPVAYFDGPGGTQVPRRVVEAMSDYLYHHNANTHWQYPTSVETDRLLAEARSALADFLNAAPDEISFGANMTTLTFHLARALGRGFGPGDEIVTTELDHQANVAPWQAVARERGVTLRTARMIPGTGQLDWEHFQSLIGPRTRVVAIGAASNALGTINDVPRAIALAGSVGALSFVDAVHYAPHELVDVRAWGCDFLACSAYKFHGPHLGVLYGRRALVAGLDVPKLEPAPEDPPERLETGTQNHEGIVGAAAAVEFLAGLGGSGSRRARLAAAFGELHRRGTALLTRMWEGLTVIPGVEVFGAPPSAPRTPTVSFVVRGMTADQVSSRLAEDGVYVSSGDFYATRVVERLGHAADGLVRAGCACYTTAEEVDRLVEGVGRMVGD